MPNPNPIDELRRLRSYRAIRDWIKEQGLPTERRGTKHLMVRVNGQLVTLPGAESNDFRGVLNMRSDLLKAMRS